MKIYLAHNNSNATAIKVLVNALRFRFTEVIVNDFKVINTISDITEITAYYQRAIRQTSLTDIIICECSETLEHLSPILSLAKQAERPVIIAKSSPVASNLRRVESVKEIDIYQCTYDLNNFDVFVQQLNSQVELLLDKKYIMVISPEITKYLDWRSDFARMSKAEIVRKAIKAAIKADKEYKLFTKQA